MVYYHIKFKAWIVHKVNIYYVFLTNFVCNWKNMVYCHIKFKAWIVHKFNIYSIVLVLLTLRSKYIWYVGFYIEEKFTRGRILNICKTQTCSIRMEYFA